MARIQLSSNDTAITMNRDDRISPVMCGERYTGKNVSTAINVAPNSGMAVVPTADSMAGRLRMPRCMFTNAASYTTIALSTSIPMAIIMAASDIRCRAIPVAHMYINVPKIEKISPLPISMPFFIPMNRSSTPATVITDIIRFSTKPSLPRPTHVLGRILSADCILRAVFVWLRLCMLQHAPTYQPHCRRPQ